MSLGQPKALLPQWRGPLNPEERPLCLADTLHPVRKSRTTVLSFRDLPLQTGLVMRKTNKQTKHKCTWTGREVFSTVPCPETQTTSPRESQAREEEKQGNERTRAETKGSDARKESEEGVPGGAFQNGCHPLRRWVTPKAYSRTGSLLSYSDAPTSPGFNLYASPPRLLQRFTSSFRKTSSSPSAASALEFGTKRTVILTGNAVLRR